MSKLFEATAINTLKLQNRFVRSATFEGMADEDGSCTQRLTDLMIALAKGGVGLIITGHSYISKEGKGGQWRMGIESDKQIPGLERMTQAVHNEKGKLIIQLAHAGYHSNEPKGASLIEIRPGFICSEMAIADIHKAIEDFALAAVRAKKAGFDGVQIHAGHGYLLSQFLSPFFNKRKDDYGGKIENRARITLEVFDRIRLLAGDHFPILLKINSDDFLENGFNVYEMLQVCRMLEEAGVDAIELSGGCQISGKFFPPRPRDPLLQNPEVYYREAAQLYKKNLKTPLILVGGIRSFRVAKSLVEEGFADYVSLSRPLVREPGLINRWKSGDLCKSACLSDNLCLEAVRSGKGLYCVAAENVDAKG